MIGKLGVRHGISERRGRTRDQEHFVRAGLNIVVLYRVWALFGRACGWALGGWIRLYKVHVLELEDVERLS